MQQSFDASDNQLSTLTPAEAAAGRATLCTYDAWNNRVSKTDPNGNVSAYYYDPVNRLQKTAWTRGAWGSTVVPPGCVDSSGSAPIPDGRIECFTSVGYSGVDEVVSASDGNGQVTTYWYDARHLPIMESKARDYSTNVVTAWWHDADGNTIHTCPPDDYARGGCGPSAGYGVHNTYDGLDHLVSVTSHRVTNDNGQTTTYEYDADGNRTSTTDPDSHRTVDTFNLLHRKVAESVPRDATHSFSTTWLYDPAGNTTAVTAPGGTGPGRITAYSYDKDNRVVDSVSGADSTSAAAAGLPDARGGINARSRNYYDVDGHLVGTVDPRAFTSSTSGADPRYLQRTDYDTDGRPIASSSRALTMARLRTRVMAAASSRESAQRLTRPRLLLQACRRTPPGVGVCVTRFQYDYAGNLSRVYMPTSNGSDNRYVSYSYTDDNLVVQVSEPDPMADGGTGSAPTRTHMTGMRGWSNARMPRARSGSTTTHARRTGLPADRTPATSPTGRDHLLPDYDLFVRSQRKRDHGAQPTTGADQQDLLPTTTCSTTRSTPQATGPPTRMMPRAT